MGAADTGLTSLGPLAPCPAFAVALLPDRITIGHVTTPKTQTVFVALICSQGVTKKAKVLWDGGSVETLIRSNFFDDSHFYPSKSPKTFAMADSKSELPGGNEQVDITMSLTAIGHSMRPLLMDLKPYRVQMEWDIIFGHKDQYLHCLAHFPHWNCLALHAPYPNLWVEGWRSTCQNGIPLLLTPLPLVCPRPKHPGSPQESAGSGPISRASLSSLPIQNIGVRGGDARGLLMQTHLEVQELIDFNVARAEWEGLIRNSDTTFDLSQKIFQEVEPEGCSYAPEALKTSSIVESEGALHSELAEQLRQQIMQKFGSDLLSGQIKIPANENAIIKGPHGMSYIDLVPGTKPKWVRPYRLVGEREAAMNEVVQDLLEKGFLEESWDTQWANPVFPVPKKKPGTWRLVGDYRYINQCTLPDNHPLPLIEDLIEKHGKNKLFTIIDMKQGFHQMPLKPESRACTSFIVGSKKYQWKVMPMGIKNAPCQFQRMMDFVLQGLDCASCYIDDIIIGTPENGLSESDLLRAHAEDVNAVLSRLREWHLVAEIGKTAFFTTQVQFCGHILANGQRRPAEGKMVSIQKWEQPKTVKEVRGFLGLCNYYAVYIHNYALIAAPLMDLLKGKSMTDKKPHLVKWTPEALKAFIALKEAMLTWVPLKLIDFTKPFWIFTDASGYAVGACLGQLDSDTGIIRPVAFFSRKLTSSQLNWTPREKECYAIVMALHKWQSWIGLNEVTVRTDHKTLESWHKEVVQGSDGPSPRQARWHQLFSRFKLQVEYAKGGGQCCG